MNKEFLASYRIYYEDTDAGGVVYYANYLKFFERARTDFLRAKSISQLKLKNERSIIFLVSKCQIEFKSPAKLDDLVIIKTIITNISAASIHMKQEMNNEDEKLLNILEVEIVCADAGSMKPKKIPEDLRTKFLLPSSSTIPG